MTDQSHIAKKLKAARDFRELSLKEVAHETRIPVTTLSALEEHDYTHFSSPTYAKSFLDQYANFLRVDVQELIDELDDCDAISRQKHITYLDSKKSYPSHQRNNPHSENPARTSPGNRSQLSQPLLITLISGLIIAAGIWGSIIVEKKLNAAPPNSTQSPKPKLAKHHQIPASPSTSSAEISATQDTSLSAQPPRAPRVIASSHSNTITGTAPSNSDEKGPENEPDLPFSFFPEGETPPRAIIVNEDE